MFEHIVMITTVKVIFQDVNDLIYITIMIDITVYISLSVKKKLHISSADEMGQMSDN